MALISYNPGGVALSRYSTPALAARHDGQGNFSVLPNVAPLAITRSVGPNPGTARFRYRFDEVLLPGFPSRVEQVMGLDAYGPYVVRADDRLAILVADAFGNPWCVFDGFAQVPQADVTPESEEATFGALSVECRCFDRVLAGAVWRNAPLPKTVNDTPTGLPARFNPDGMPNMTAKDCDAGDPPQTYPTFLDASLVDSRINVGEAATLVKAVRYCLAANDERYVTNPRFPTLDDILASRCPDPSTPTFDPSQAFPGPLMAHDLVVTGKEWPVAVQELVAPHNFMFLFRTDASPSGKPATAVTFFRTDSADANLPKHLMLMPAGAALDPASNNLIEFHLARDASRIANRIVVEGEPCRAEAGFVLAPLFVPQLGDNGAAKTFNYDDPDFKETNRDMYRVYGLDETGDGHYDMGAGDPSFAVPDLSAIFGKPQGQPPMPQYAVRRRPGISPVYSKVAVTGERSTKRLYISRDFDPNSVAGGAGIWNGTGTWQEVADGWELLKDRMGIRITATQIDSFKYGGRGSATAGGVVNLVKSMNGPQYDPNAKPPQAYPRMTFLLVCVIESDWPLIASAEARPTSTTSFEITRFVNARDRFVYHAIHQSSYLLQPDAKGNRTSVVDRDDTQDATDYAESVRATNECAAVEGTARIPRLSWAYAPGDKVSFVEGRNIRLRVNGGDADEGPVYPTILRVDWTFEPSQGTVVHFGDLAREAAPPPEHDR